MPIAPPAEHAAITQAHAVAGAPAPARRPDITILIPTFDRPGYLDTCLKHHVAHFAKAGIDCEILVCDNASGEASAEVLARHAAACPQLRVVRQPRNIGGFANSIYGQKHARGLMTVVVGDDDLLIPDVVVAQAERFKAEPDLVMIQAPWFLMNEKQRNRIVGASYTLDEEVVIARGEFGKAADLVLGKTIFPEMYAVRTDVADEIMGVNDEFAYHYFVVLARAIEAGTVVFSPAPHAIVTGVSRHGNHAGGAETLAGWDKFRGGMEVLIGRALESDPGFDGKAARERMQAFVNERMAFAMRMHFDRKAWHKAWLLYRRLRAYGAVALGKETHDELLSLAGMDAAVAEALRFGADDIVVEDKLYAILLNVLPVSKLDAALHCESDWTGARRGRVAYLGMGRRRTPDTHPDDVVIDVAAAMRRISA